MAVNNLDHIGIIVENLEVAIEKYQHTLGVQLDHIEDYGDGLLKIAFLQLGNVLIELIKPMKPGSSAWDFLKENGEGIEHIAFEVDDIDSEWNHVLQKGIPVTDTKPKPGAGDTRICFLRRDALCGVLGEFVSHNK